MDRLYLAHIGTHHYVVDSGVREVVARLTANLNVQHIHLSSPIVAIHSDPKIPDSPQYNTSMTVRRRKSRVFVI
jgi:DNA primase